MAKTTHFDMELTSEEFKELIKDNENLVVVDFYAEWCMPCLMIAPALDELSEELNNVKFVKINIEENRGLTNMFKVSSIPCLVAFKDGKEVGRIVGAVPKEMIEEKLKEFL